MSFNDMLSDFQSILNRDDCTDDQASVFLKDAIRSIQRVARLPSMERRLITTAGTDGMEWIVVPPDLLKIKRLLVPNSWGSMTALQHVDPDDLLRRPLGGYPTHWAREQSQIWLRGAVPAGMPLHLIYWGTFTPFATGDSENELSTAAPDLAVYKALSYAGDFYEHPSTDRWEARYQQLLAEVQALADEVDMDAGPTSINPMSL